MLTPALRDAEIALYDIDPERLEESYIMVTSLNKNINEGRATIKKAKYLGVGERRAALAGADFVVNAIQVGGYDPCTITDFENTQKIRPASDDSRHTWHRRNLQSARTIRHGRFCARYRGDVCPRALFPQLYKPDGYLDRLYASFHES